jgi:SAM-dependent methyltransferase
MESFFKHSNASFSNWDAVKETIIENYKSLFNKHGDSSEAVQLSKEGQLFRFEKLIEIADLNGKDVLDIGCGLGELYLVLSTKYSNINYTGVDIVEETTKYAANKYKDAHFYCQDLFSEPLSGKFHYVFISSIFNNAILNASDFLNKMITTAFDYCTEGLSFNFISNRVNFRDAAMAYYDPREVFNFCLENLSKKVSIFHHYKRCDVAVFVYR